MNFVYPATLTPDPDGGFVVTFPNWHIAQLANRKRRNPSGVTH